jgi:hypothetical protein
VDLRLRCVKRCRHERVGHHDRAVIADVDGRAALLLGAAHDGREERSRWRAHGKIAGGCDLANRRATEVASRLEWLDHAACGLPETVQWTLATIVHLAARLERFKPDRDHEVADAAHRSPRIPETIPES